MILETAARNAACDAIVGLLDNGTIEFQTGASVEVATCTFGATAFGAADTGVATANAITKDSDATGGTIEKAVLKSSAPADVATVADSEISGTKVIGAGDEVNVTSMTITVPAS